MGKAYSYFNIWAVSTIVYTTEIELESVIQIYESSYREKHVTIALIDENGQETQLQPVNYIISEADFLTLLNNKNFHASDIDILLNLFRLIDNRGFREIDIRDVLISFTLLVAKSVYQCFETCMKFMEREGTQIIDKLQLVHIFKLLNATCNYFGDRNLSMDQLQDLADSVYTSIGRIDGTIYYPHFIEYITAHPIIEMFMSPQFQGSVKDKLLTDQSIESMVKKT